MKAFGWNLEICILKEQWNLESQHNQQEKPAVYKNNKLLIQLLWKGIDTVSQMSVLNTLLFEKISFACLLVYYAAEKVEQKLISCQ